MNSFELTRNRSGHAAARPEPFCRVGNVFIVTTLKNGEETPIELYWANFSGNGTVQVAYEKIV